MRSQPAIVEEGDEEEDDETGSAGNELTTLTKSSGSMLRLKILKGLDAAGGDVPTKERKNT